MLRKGYTINDISPPLLDKNTKIQIVIPVHGFVRCISHNSNITSVNNCLHFVSKCHKWEKFISKITRNKKTTLILEYLVGIISGTVDIHSEHIVYI